MITSEKVSGRRESKSQICPSHQKYQDEVKTSTSHNCGGGEDSIVILAEECVYHGGEDENAEDMTSPHTDRGWKSREEGACPSNGRLCKETHAIDDRMIGEIKDDEMRNRSGPCLILYC